MALRVSSAAKMGASSPAYEDWAAILDRLRQGDRAALVRMTQLVTGFLTRYGAYEMRDAWDDVTQEVLIAIIRTAEQGKLREPRALVSYVGLTTRSKMVDWIRKQKKPGAANADSDLEDRSQALPAEEGLSPDWQMDLKGALETLPDRERQVVSALYLDGYRYEEAAKKLGIPLGTLKRLQTQGLKLLRGKFLATGAEL